MTSLGKLGTHIQAKHPGFAGPSTSITAQTEKSPKMDLVKMTVSPETMEEKENKAPVVRKKNPPCVPCPYCKKVTFRVEFI